MTQQMKDDIIVEVCRTAHGNRSFRVRGAATLEEAEVIALDQAGNHVYSEHSSDYQVLSAYPSQPDDNSDDGYPVIKAESSGS